MQVEDVEEFLAKVETDIIKVDLLTAENLRLTKYDGELRHSPVKEQAHDAVIRIPDGGRGGQLIRSESLEEVNQSQIQTCEAVVFNSIVTDLIFKHLDVENIKGCRLVCKNWNETSCRILSRQNRGYGLAVRLEKEQLKGTIATFRRRTILWLHSIVADAPPNWFSKALLDQSFLEMPGVQSVLQRNLGYRLRSIEITRHSFLFQDLHKLLVDWCPNLEQLALPPYLTVQDGEFELEDGYQKLIFPQPLKLTGLFMQDQFCISIVEASLNLKTLSCVADMYGFQFFKELQTCTEVTRNLEDMTLDCSDPPILDWSELNRPMGVFNLVQFSSKLRNLTINRVGESQAKELSEALNKLGGTLRKLVLIVSDVRFPGPKVPKLELPEMKKLTEFRYVFPVHPSISINSLEFLTAMPNLKTLYLGQLHCTSPSLDSPNRDNFIDNLFFNSQQLRKNHQNQLKELYLIGIIQSPNRTFEMMSLVCPNLTKLVVRMPVFYKKSKKNQLEKYYKDVFSSDLSEMANLKELYLDFRIPSWEFEDAEFDYMSLFFCHLNNLSNLNHLTVRDNSKSTTSLTGDKLLEIPNLQRVTLIGLKVELMAAKDLTMLLCKHEIQLEIKGPEVDEDFLIHFEENRTFKYRQFTRYPR